VSLAVSCVLLLVDNHAISRRMLARALRMSNHSVQEARTGEEAIQMLIRRRFGGVISESALPGQISGLDVLMAQKQRWADSKLLLIGNFASLGDQQKAYALGASYMEKPLSMEQLMSFITG
jgi:DNA-binding NtrC family response regulator